MGCPPRDVVRVRRAACVAGVACVALWALSAAAVPTVAQAPPLGRAVLPGTGGAGGTAAAVSVGYREAADRFELLDQVSAWWPDYVEPAYRRAWEARGLGRAGDDTLFATYRELRTRHVDRTGQGGGDAAAWRTDSTGGGLFTAGAALTSDPVAAAFYASASVEEALAASPA
jgi:hypothetical protein